MEVVAIALESPPADVRKLAAEKKRGRVVLATAALREALGGAPAVPTFLLVDSQGVVVRTFHGAPPDLHAQVEEALAGLR